MKLHAQRLIQFIIGDVDKEDLSIPPENYVKQRLVLCVHDEMTAQAHNSPVKSWVFEDQHSLRKKGARCGIHQSDIICLTVGWVKDASQTLEYGKNYEGYWNREILIKQVQFRSQFRLSFQLMISPHEDQRKNYTIIRGSPQHRTSSSDCCR
jgi:hypothetical protein